MLLLPLLVLALELQALLCLVPVLIQPALPLTTAHTELPPSSHMPPLPLLLLLQLLLLLAVRPPLLLFLLLQPALH